MVKTPRHFAAALALCAATLFAYANGFRAGFALDNKILLLQDPRIQEVSAEHVGLIFNHTYWWPHGESYLYRPVATLSYLFNYAVLGDAERPAGYHWVNLLLHLGNVLLAYALALRLTRRFWASVAIAGLWALHPVLTESVTNIVGRPDLLAGMATLGGLLMYLKAGDAGGIRRVGWLTGLMLVTAIGVFSKESAAVIPGVLVLYELCRWERKRLRILLLGILATLPAVAALGLRLLVQLPGVHFPFADNPLAFADFWTARLTAVKIMGKYLALLVWPARLSCDYSYPQIPLARGSAGDWLAWTLVAAAVGTAAILFRRNRTAFFFACFGFLAFLSTANLLFPIGTIMAERFLYLPSLGLIGCAVLAAPIRGRAAAVVVAVLACAFAVRVWSRNADWRDDLALDTAAVRACPASYKTHAMLAAALFASDANHTNLDRAIEEAEKSMAALDGLPDIRNVPQAYAQAGEFYLLKGDHQRAVAALQHCVAIYEAIDRAQPNPADAPASPAYVDAWRTLATAYLRLSDPARALDAAMHARALDPAYPAIYRQISDIQRVQGHADDAAVTLMAGATLTSDQSLRGELIDLYRAGLDGDGCALVRGPYGPAINPECALVHRHLCAAAGELIRIHLAARDRNAAAESRSQAVAQFGCAAAPLDSLLK